MSQVVALIDLIAQGKNVEASEVLNQELLARSYQNINDITPQVAQEYFAPVVGDASEDDQINDEETETEEDSEE
ncbi:hypothetical protein SCRM01_040 [Synechococcus phage S-CRM01]|uniref:hypothetical protein n=1 Tax=Synechococcus phage S-CRM01 TaxID=1026955 RepID=UPI000209E352|nr:hypothetical protein SCRM01_040 [Synechococcus phage S-CRM01]AEC52987.1 hypothetical protein SCRM01_040 [Synechococcus phage S-CRM01]